jgi:amidohydrolase
MLLGILTGLVAICGERPAVAADPREWISQNLDDLVELYKHFHRHPELSFHEEQTARRLAEELQKTGVDVTTNVGGYGVVGILKNGDGATLMLRTDLDALPVVERTGLDYASTATTKDDDGVEVGVMHACGHDIHITNLIGVARYLAAHKSAWSGTVVFIGQPAEERGAGAVAMLKDGLFTRFPRPDFAVALHADATLAAGMVSYRGGYVMANVDSVDITVRGRGGHGSFPQGTVDPIVQAAQLVLDLQTIVSREISPLEPAVVTVGSIHAGTKHNIIPDSCHLQLTIRSYSDKVREQIREAIHRKAKAVAESHRAPEPIVKYSEGTPSLYNDENLVERVVPAFQRVLGPENVTQSNRSMGGEDFSQYGRAGVPVFMYRLGSVDRQRLEDFANKGRLPPSLHSAEYYPEPRETLKTGILTMTAAVQELLPAKEPEAQR